MQTSEFTPRPRLRLTEARTLHHWSQQEVADRIGTTHVNVSRWERGMTRPNPYFRRKLCALFDKTEEELELVPPTPTQEERSAAVVSAPPYHTAATLYDPTIPLLPAIQIVGRSRELAQIRQRLCSGGKGALTALNGLPGVGKTTLAIALAHDPAIRAHFTDGVLWVGLGPHPNIPSHLSRWGTLLGVSATEIATSTAPPALTTMTSTEAWARALRTAIGSRALLVVIDDAWQLEDALACQVGGPNCAHLVTTRFPTISAHLSIEGATAISELGKNESMALLRLLAPGVIDREEQKATTLVQAVGGLPLALTLMGNYLRKQGHSGQSRRILTALERLSNAEERLQMTEAHAPVESHPSLSPEMSLSLQSVIAVTDQQLSKPVQTALYALSIFPPKPDSFSEEAALAVASCSMATLDTLSDAGLLESSGENRYSLHQTIADYAHVHFKEQQEHAAYDRLIHYALDYLEAHQKDYELLTLESAMILAALEAAYTIGRREELVRGVNAFVPFLVVRGLYTLAEQHLQRAYQAALTLSDSYGITGVLLYKGEIAQKQGDYSRAEQYFQEGLTLAHQSSDVRAAERISSLLNDLGWVLWKQGTYTQAETYLQEGLALARQNEDRERISSILQVLGSLYASRGNYIQSETYLEEGLALAQQIGDREHICVLLISLGATVGEQGKHVQAKMYFQEGLLLARQIGHREWMSLLLINLGDAEGEMENYAQAEAYFQEGLALARQLGHREWMSALLTNLGLMIRKQGHYEQAEIYFHESLLLARQIGIPQITSSILYEYGNLYLDRQQIKAAEAAFREILITISEEDQDLLALAQYGLSRVTLTQYNIAEARKLGEASVKALEGMGHRSAKEVRGWFDLITS